MINRTLLIDGDEYIYRAAAAAEEPIDWGDGLWTLHAYEEPCIAALVGALDRILSDLNGTQMVIALTDTHNFRKDILPTYKSNRKDTRKPMLLPVLRQFLIDNFKTMVRPGLEADDILGILSTGSVLKDPGEKIIVSVDKDLKSIPGLLYRQGEIMEITEAQADHWHLIQTLAGDPTDGYAGCPGIGIKTAEKILEKAEVGSEWNSVVDAFEKAGLSEEEALRQARVARICRVTDYNFKKKEVILWKPISPANAAI